MMKIVYDTSDISLCYLCHQSLDRGDIELDHVLPKGMVIMPVHSWCNQKKKNYPLLPFPSEEERRKLVSQSTKAGLAKAKAAGKRLGSPPKLTLKQRKEVHQLRNSGIAVEVIAKIMKVNRRTIYRVLKEEP